MIRIIFKKSLKMNGLLLCFGFALLLIYSSYINFILLISKKDPANSLQLSSFFIQASMLFIGVVGYRLAISTNTNNNQLEKIVKKEFIRLQIVNTLFLATISFIFVCVQSITYFIIIEYYELNNSFLGESIGFYINNLLIPILITGFIGFLIGICSSTYISFGIFIIIWFILSPANTNFISNFLAHTKLLFIQTWFNNTNVSIIDPGKLFYSFYGFELLWWKKLIFFTFVLLLVFLFIFYIQYKQKVMKIITVVILFLSIACYGLITNSPSSLEKDEQFLKNYQLAAQNQIVPHKEYFDFKIKSIKLNIDNFKYFDVKAKYKINDISSDKIVFTLYNEYKVKKIILNQKEELNFIRKGDYIEVQLPHKETNTELNVTILYKGKGAYGYPSTNTHMLLLENIPWIPINVPLKTRLLFNNEVVNLPISLNKKVPVTLSYNGKHNPDYINLKKTKENNYKGFANGVTMILGDITKQSLNSYDIYYPKSWFSYNREIKSYLKEYEGYLKSYNKTFKTNHVLPKKILLLPPSDLNSINMSGVGNKDYIVLYMDPNHFTQWISINNFIPFQIDSINQFQYKISSNDQYLSWYIFNTVLGRYLTQEKNVDDKLLTFQNQVIDVNSQDKYRNLIRQLIHLEQKKITNRFISSWKKILKDNNPDDFDQLYKLMETLNMSK